MFYAIVNSYIKKKHNFAIRFKESEFSPILLNNKLLKTKI